jgi:predicted MarR family transcription regulator
MELYLSTPTRLHGVAINYTNYVQFVVQCLATQDAPNTRRQDEILLHRVCLV